MWFEGFQMSPDHSLTNKKGNLLATSTSKIDSLRYFHQKHMFFYQMAVWSWPTRMLGGCCYYDGQHPHQQVSQTGDIINTPLTIYVSTEPIGSAQICSSTVPCTKSLRRRTHIFPQAMNHQPTSRNGTWVGSISSPIYHWFLMFRTNDVGQKIASEMSGILHEGKHMHPFFSSHFRNMILGNYLIESSTSSFDESSLQK